MKDSDSDKTMMEIAICNALNLVAELDSLQSVLYGFNTAGRCIFNKDDDNKSKFFDGLNKMREAIYSRHCEALANCFPFVGTMNEDMIGFARETFVKRFGDKSMEIMSFLETYGTIPHAFSGSKRDEWQREIDNSLEIAKLILKERKSTSL